MTYERFEDLPVWQKAAELYELTEELLEAEAFKATRGYRDQLDRAALSVSNNIAEGFERGTTNELLAFIYIARGSAGEVRSMLILKLRRAHKANWPANLKSEIHRGKLLAPVAWLGGLVAKLGHQGPAPPDRQVPPCSRAKETRPGVWRNPPQTPACLASQAQRSRGAGLDLKSPI